MRICIDFYHPEATFDLKSARRATAMTFITDRADFQYDLLSFMYTLGQKLHEGSSQLSDFIFIEAQNEAPHSVHQITSGQSCLENAVKQFRKPLSMYCACMATGYWPDASVEIL